MIARSRWGIATLAATGSVLGVLLLYYAFAMPTSDVRTRIHILLLAAPGQLGGIAFGVLFAAALATLILAGWRERAVLPAAATGAALGIVVLYSRIMGVFVWMHQEDITSVGQYLRAVVAFTLIAGSIVWARKWRRPLPAAA